MTRTFLVNRQSLADFEWADAPPRPLLDGEVRLDVAAFALTSNNITYAAFGEAMHYWRFFPSGDDRRGCIPVWGFGVVRTSRCVGVAEGERVYGYFPMASDVVLQPSRVNDAGFSDGAAHRSELHPVYNHYVRCSADPGYEPANEAQQAVLRPLFTTSFLIDDFFADNSFFGAGTLVLSSASSKTAYGTAFLLARRTTGVTHAPRVVGLTSPANLEFTRNLGCYDEVLTYTQVHMLPADAQTAFVDFSGNAFQRTALHSHIGDRLVYSCSVGGTHWESLGSAKGLPGPRPVLFFAPAQVKKRLAEWGSTELAERMAEAWSAFMVPIKDARRPWMKVVHGSDEAAVERTYRELISGRTDPSMGHLLVIHTAG